jgi:hypothetical protein
MSTVAVSTVLNARAAANEWLSEHLPDRFAVGIPQLNEQLGTWRVPIWLAYPQLEPLGPVGEIVIDAASGVVIQHTPLAEIKTNAQHYYEQHRDQIEAPVL